MPKVRAAAFLFVQNFLMVIPHEAWSQSVVAFPTKTINLIVPFPPGPSIRLSMP
jgi:tripartite-type tricarboxylate transporter receptor subunit TctC